jgi:hypothetical protein
MDEIDDMNDYGYFIDIDFDSESESSKNIIEYREYHYYINKDNSKEKLFYVNTFCCITLSLLFLKVWIFT